MSAESDLIRFAAIVLVDSRISADANIDGVTLQDWAEECGLLDCITVTEPCGELCSCAGRDFPLECLRIKPDVLAVMKKEAQKP